jgi:putative transposase
MGYASVFSQIIKHIPRGTFDSIVRKHLGDKGVRTLDCWTWFGALLFGQLTGHDSIRAIERLFAHGQGKLVSLGLGDVRKSTLADANRTRPIAILEDLFKVLLANVERVAPKQHRLRFKGPLFALDTTTIKLCLSLSPWAHLHHNKGGCKIHTAIDLANDLPQFAVITQGNRSDIAIAKKITYFKKGATVIFDKGYVDYTWFNQFNQDGIFFVTRFKDNSQFKVVESRQTNRTQGFLCYQIIYLKSHRGRRYQGKLRRIRYREPDTGRRLTFLTNRFDLTTSTICDIYKARWDVEVFFKTLKQNLRIKKFLGTSENAVKAQIWVALIAYLLVMLLRLLSRSSISMPDAMAVVGSLLLLNASIAVLLGQLPRTTRHPPPSQLRLPFTI